MSGWEPVAVPAVRGTSLNRGRSHISAVRKAVGFQKPERRVKAHGRIDRTGRQTRLVRLVRGTIPRSRFARFSRLVVMKDASSGRSTRTATRTRKNQRGEMARTTACGEQRRNSAWLREPPPKRREPRMRNTAQGTEESHERCRSWRNAGPCQVMQGLLRIAERRVKERPRRMIRRNQRESLRSQRQSNGRRCQGT